MNTEAKNNAENIYTIPAANLERLNDKIAKINHRAEKIGASHVSVVIINQYTTIDPKFINEAKQNPDIEYQFPRIEWVVVQLIGGVPKIDGYRFIGTLDHMTIPGSVLVRNVPGEYIPEHFFHASNECEHCNTHRDRYRTFILLNEQNGEYIQVGRTCLDDFFGHDPNKAATFLSFIFNFKDTFENEFGYREGNNVDFKFDKVALFEVTISIIRRFGWVSKRQADYYGDFSTSQHVKDYFFPPVNGFERRMKQKLKDELEHREEDEQEAIDTIKWINQKNSSEDYFHNLQQLAKLSYIPARYISTWISAVATRQREIETLKHKTTLPKLNEHYGEVKQRYDLTLYVEKISKLDGAFGVTWIHNFSDMEGRKFVWFANIDSRMEAQKVYKVKGTIKKHDYYGDTKQTHLNRVKVMIEEGRLEDNV